MIFEKIVALLSEQLGVDPENITMDTSFEELGDCVSGTDRAESGAECRLIEELISTFLRRQKEERRNVFLRRYWYFDSIAEICAATGFSPGKVKSILYETRRKLRLYLESEGIEV